MKKIICSPADKELMDVVIKAACELYNLNEETLLQTRHDYEIANIRQICYWIILTNTELKPKQVGVRFGMSRTEVYKMKDKIDSHCKIYPQTRNTIQSINSIANNFEKKHAWQLSPLPNTRH